MSPTRHGHEIKGLSISAWVCLQTPFWMPVLVTSVSKHIAITLWSCHSIMTAHFYPIFSIGRTVKLFVCANVLLVFGKVCSRGYERLFQTHYGRILVADIRVLLRVFSTHSMHQIATLQSSILLLISRKFKLSHRNGIAMSMSHNLQLWKCHVAPTWQQHEWIWI